MKKLYIIPALLLLFNGFISSQENSEEVVEVSTVEALLALVKEGKTQEQAANSNREAEFMANKNKQASILACLLYTSPSPRDRQKSRMPSSA